MSRVGGLIIEIQRSGVAVVLLKNDELLLVKRNGSYEGLWCIPCGHVEYDEDIRVAAKREFKEETGLDVMTLGLFLRFILIFMTWKIKPWEYGFWGHVRGANLKPVPMPVKRKFFPWG